MEGVNGLYLRFNRCFYTENRLWQTSSRVTRFQKLVLSRDIGSLTSDLSVRKTEEPQRKHEVWAPMLF